MTLPYGTRGVDAQGTEVSTERGRSCRTAPGFPQPPHLSPWHERAATEA